MAGNGKGSGHGSFNNSLIILLIVLISMLRAPVLVCTASNNQGGENSVGVSLEVVHRRRRLTDNRGGFQSTRQSQPNGVSLPAKDESTQALGSHSVLVRLGSKKTPLNLVIDTGSDMTWTQCQPCRNRCYKQGGPMFNPKTSETYSVVPCSRGPCEYGMQYADDSFSFGTVATDNLALSGDVVVSAFLFGCGQNNTLGGHTDAGVMGLGNTDVSIVSQTSSRFGKVFSYCLNTGRDRKGTGHLSFGAGASRYRGSVKYTELLHDYSESGFYLVSMEGISVNGEELAIDPQVFGNGTLVDSGRSVTVLPLEAYRVLNDSFTRQMGSKYPRAQGDGVLENCYDLSGAAAAADIPMVSFKFGARGGVVVDLNRASVVVDVTGDPHRSRACLAFVPDHSPDQMGIFGSYQQQTLEMVYDVAGGRLGFGQNGCA